MLHRIDSFTSYQFQNLCGLKHRNVERKYVKHYVTTDDSDRNLILLYTSYIDLVGDKDGKFYKRPISGTLKFSKQNIYWRE